jgi:hypothetical protein
MPKITGIGGTPVVGVPAPALDVSRETELRHSQLSTPSRGTEADLHEQDSVSQGHGISDYTEWTYAALLEELKERGLPRTGKTVELIERLREDDAK